MRRAFRRILTLAGLGVGVALGGCGSFDPSDWLDFDKEKPIPGERQLVFPEGVPGVPQGVPAELVKGNQPPPTDPAMMATAAPDRPDGQPQTIEPAVASRSVAARTETEPKAEPAPAAKPVAKRKPKVAARPKPKPAKKPAPKQPPAQTTAEPAKAEPAASQPAQSAQRSGAPNPVWGPHPTRGASAPWPPPQPQHRAPAPWPEAPSPNTFSR